VDCGLDIDTGSLMSLVDFSGKASGKASPVLYDKVGEPCSLPCGCPVRAEMEQLEIQADQIHGVNTTNIENMGLITTSKSTFSRVVETNIVDVDTA
jgi:hypothetical protein